MKNRIFGGNGAMALAFTLAVKRCVMEARLAGLQPITVSAEGSSLEQALDRAADKLEKTLKRTLGRLDDPKGRTSYAGMQTNWRV